MLNNSLKNLIFSVLLLCNWSYTGFEAALGDICFFNLSIFTRLLANSPGLDQVTVTYLYTNGWWVVTGRLDIWMQRGIQYWIVNVLMSALATTSSPRSPVCKHYSPKLHISPIDSESVKSAMQSWPCHHVTVIKKIGFDGARLVRIVNKRLRNMKLQLNCNTTPMGITTSGNSIHALYKIQCSCSVLWKGLNLRLPTDFWYLGRRGSQGPC